MSLLSRFSAAPAAGDSVRSDPGPELPVFLRRAILAVLIGLLVGAVGVAFHYGIDLATELRQEHHWLLCLLPLGGLAIVLLYQVCGMEKDQGTNLVLVAVR